MGGMCEPKSLSQMRREALAKDGPPTCPGCGCTNVRVTNTWRLRDGTIRRLKRCRHCGWVTHTTETADS